MDDIDRKILRITQSHPSLSMHELAERVGLSHTPCWRRLKQLEKEGIVAQRYLVLDQDAVGLPITVFANLKLKKHDEATLLAFERTVLDCAQILECFSIAGGSDYVLRIVVQSVAAYELFLKKTLLHLPGVSEVHSQFALKRVKLTSNLPV
jgi:Lrp/AsnC family transcriptional regulator